MHRYRATIAGANAKVDVASIDSITSDAPLHLNLSQKKFRVSAQTPGSNTDQVQAIVDRRSESGDYALVDLRPASPSQPTMVEVSSLNQAIERAGLDVPFRPQGGLPKRIDITADQLQKINQQLAPESRFVAAVTEDSQYTPAGIMVQAEQEANLIKPLPGATTLTEAERREIRMFSMRLPDAADGLRYEQLSAASRFFSAQTESPT